MNPAGQVIRATAVAIAATAVLSGVAVVADATGSSRPPNLQKSLAQLVAAGAPGAILLTREGNRKDRRRQAVLMVNQSAESLPKPFAPLYFRLLARAFCQSKS